MPATLRDAASRYSHRRAVTDDRGTWTYLELYRFATAVAAWLISEDISQQARVMVRLPADRRAAAIVHGCLLAGVIAVPVSPAAKPFQLRQLLADCTPALVVCPDHERDTVAGLVDTDTGQVRGIDQLWPLVDASVDDPAIQRSGQLSGDDIALLMYTSGTTSSPKAVVCPHSAVAFVVSAVHTALRYQPDDVVFGQLPLSFDYALHQLFLCAAAGAELVLSSASNMEALNRIRACRATVVPIVPTLAQILLGLARRDRVPLNVRMFTNTGADLAPSTAAELRQRFPGAVVRAMYGLTECKRVTAGESDGDIVRPGSVGRPLVGTEAFAADPDGRRLPPGEVGEILVRGPHVMSGYWNAPTLTTRRFQADPRTGERTLHTGDHGYHDAAGNLYLVGRRDDIFKRRGVRASTLEIEAAAVDIPGVLAAVAVPPAEDHDLAVVVTGEISAHTVLTELAARLDAARVPARCVVLAAMPITPHGKVDRIAVARGLLSPTTEGPDK